MNKTDSELLALIEQYMGASSHPDQVEYRKQVEDREFANKARFLAELKRIAAMGDFRGKRILDVGCGFGWQAFAMSLFGNRVTGIDILPSMIDGMTASIATMRSRGLDFDLTPVCGDICKIDFPDSFDEIYSFEAIEHVHDLRAMFSRCFDLLKPGGQLFLLNDSNALNRQTREETMAMWREREHSWEWVAQLKRWRPVEHRYAKPFIVMREKIIRQANPRLSNADVYSLCERTAGLVRPQIETAAQTGIVPTVGKFDVCRNPETGEYAERLLDPFELAAMLREAGFSTSVQHCFHRFPLNYLNGIQFKPLNLMLFNLRGAFCVVGRKR